ncbi:MAG: class I SAM-dependent methyltransferase, partial [Myxococcota bacterium]|nr:class I SAM-dependent methyltransferase [Myxococcota bacterium]
FLSYAPRMPKEFLSIYKRRRQHAFDDIPQELAQHYPKYYQRTFHWQTDGWLSKRSAELYDPGVEFLFGGTAAIMRRMLLPEILDTLAKETEPTLLDVACGTGRFIKQVSQLRPQVTITGVDLSPFYVDYAATHCRSPNVRCTTANAESLPFPDNSFSVVTCIYLFHELPKDVRRQVMSELVRVAKPGGLIAVLDSEQLKTGADIGSFLTQFPKVYHEPYYLSYLRDDLGAVMRDAGLLDINHHGHFVSRSFFGRKPSGTGGDSV